MPKKQPKALSIIGWRERVTLPEFDILRITAKIDTGARSSCLHAFHVEEFHKNKEKWERFGVHPSRRNTKSEVWCEAQVSDVRTVKNSGGESSPRYFIRTEIQLAEAAWAIELSLADRDTMGYRMLLGRTAIRNRCLVDPNESYLVSAKKARS